MANCKLCDRNPPAGNGICYECMDTLGIIEMPPPRRQASPCSKCNGFKFVRVIPREHTVVSHLERNFPEIAPMTLTQKPQLAPRMFRKGVTVDAPTVVRGDGMLEAYTCLSCGFVEWYVEDPAEIPIGPEYMSELIDYTPDAPYR